MKLPKFVAVIATLFILKSHSQNNYQIGILPSVSLGYDTSDRWSLDFKMESRQLFKERKVDLPDLQGYKYLFTDFTFMVSKKLNSKNSIGMGNLFRVNNNIFIYRFIQELKLDKESTSFNLSHRFRTDQTLETNNPIELRFRYRLSLEFPLFGKKLNTDEFYFKLNNEIFIKYKNSFNLESRIVPSLGYVLNDTQRAELGIDYRLDSFIGKQPIEHTLFIAFNYYCKL